jgi:hypothetical protein
MRPLPTRDVGARLHNDVAEVSPADTSIGIAPADEDAVFGNRIQRP